MRSFPRPTARFRAHAAALVAALSVTGAVTATVQGAAADDLKDKKHKVEHKLDKAHQDADESSAQLKAATAALLRAQADLANARANLAQTRSQLAAAQALDARMQRRLDLAVARLEQAQRDLAAGRAEVAAQEDELKQMVVSSYEQGDPALMGLSMVFTTQDPAQLAGQMNASSTVLNKQSATLDRLEAAKVLLTVKEDETRAAKVEVAQKRKEAADNLARMQALELQAEQAEQQVSEMVDLRSEARATAVKAKNADLRLLAKLQQERDRIEQLIADQASRSNGTYSGPANGNGYLDMPVDGPITSPFGWRVHPIFGYRSLHDGVDIGAGCGTPIKAAAPGKVLSEYYQSAWGNRLIIDHGLHYGVGVATISNHLSAYNVAVGDKVKRGQVVGYVGTTGWSTGCHLHFTVLQNGVAVDPMNWF